MLWLGPPDVTSTQRKALQKCFLLIDCLTSQFFSKDLSKILHLFQNLCSFISIIYHELTLISIEMPQKNLACPCSHLWDKGVLSLPLHERFVFRGLIFLFKAEDLREWNHIIRLPDGNSCLDWGLCSGTGEEIWRSVHKNITPNIFGQSNGLFGYVVFNNIQKWVPREGH